MEEKKLSKRKGHTDLHDDVFEVLQVLQFILSLLVTVQAADFLFQNFDLFRHTRHRLLTLIQQLLRTQKIIEIQ